MQMASRIAERTQQSATSVANWAIWRDVAGPESTRYQPTSRAKMRTINGSDSGKDRQAHQVLIVFDTGASTSIIPEKLWKLIGQPWLEPARPLRAYGGGRIVPLGKCNVGVRYKDITRRMQVTVVPGTETPLFRLPWTIEMGLEIPAAVVQVREIRRIDPREGVLQKLRNDFPKVLEMNGETIKDAEIGIAGVGAYLDDKGHPGGESAIKALARARTELTIPPKDERVRGTIYRNVEKESSVDSEQRSPASVEEISHELSQYSTGDYKPVSVQTNYYGETHCDEVG
ncbi:hypothetical protein ACOME3_008644 [Neoechinorhynchus agilis]